MKIFTHENDVIDQMLINPTQVNLFGILSMKNRLLQNHQKRKRRE